MKAKAMQGVLILSFTLDLHNNKDILLWYNYILAIATNQLSNTVNREYFMGEEFHLLYIYL